MKTQHTPGPWAIRHRPNTGGGHYIEPGIGEVYGEGNIPDANANLIATAPDMLAELERLAQHFGWPDTHPTCQVIAKAKGETS